MRQWVSCAVGGSESGFDVADARNDGEFGVISRAGVSVSVGHDPEVLDAGKAMLDLHPDAAEGVVVGTFVGGQWLGFGTLVGDFEAWMIGLQPLISTVGIDVSVTRYRRPLATNGKVMPASWAWSGNGQNLSIFGYRHFGLDGVALLFARVPALLAARGAFDRLLCAIKQQGLRFLRLDTDRALDPQQALGQRLDPFERAADRGLVHPVKAAQKILRHVAAVENQQNQQMVGQAANPMRTPWQHLGALTPRPVRRKTALHLAKCTHINTGDPAENGPAYQPLSAKPLHPKGESDFDTKGNRKFHTFATGLLFVKSPSCILMLGRVQVEPQFCKDRY